MTREPTAEDIPALVSLLHDDPHTIIRALEARVRAEAEQAFATQIDGLKAELATAKAAAPAPRKSKGSGARLTELEAELAAAHEVLADIRERLIEAGRVERLSDDVESVSLQAHNLRIYVDGMIEDLACAAPANGDEGETVYPKSSDGSAQADHKEHVKEPGCPDGSEPAKLDGDVAPPDVGGPFVIMRTTPQGRQVFVEREPGEHMWVTASDLDSATKYPALVDAEGTKRGLSLRRTRIISLADIVALPARAEAA